MIQLKKATLQVIEANKDEVAVENKEEVVDMDVDEVGGPMMKTTTSKEDKAEQEVMGEATQDQGMTSHTLDVIIVKSLVITFLSVEHLSIIELKRRSTTLKKEVKKLEPCCWLIGTMQEVKMIHGTLIPVQATICVEKEACLWSLMSQSSST